MANVASEIRVKAVGFGENFILVEGLSSMTTEIVAMVTRNYATNKGHSPCLITIRSLIAISFGIGKVFPFSMAVGLR